MLIAKIRIHDGLTPTEGRVEIYHDNHWATICDNSRSWDDQAAKVACSMAGYR